MASSALFRDFVLHGLRVRRAAGEHGQRLEPGRHLVRFGEAFRDRLRGDVVGVEVHRDRRVVSPGAEEGGEHGTETGLGHRFTGGGRVSAVVVLDAGGGRVDGDIVDVVEVEPPQQRDEVVAEPREVDALSDGLQQRGQLVPTQALSKGDLPDAVAVKSVRQRLVEILFDEQLGAVELERGTANGDRHRRREREEVFEGAVEVAEHALQGRVVRRVQPMRAGRPRQRQARSSGSLDGPTR